VGRPLACCIRVGRTTPYALTLSSIDAGKVSSGIQREATAIRPSMSRSFVRTQLGNYFQVALHSSSGQSTDSESGYCSLVP
jgi:hypothetical protein